MLAWALRRFMVNNERKRGVRMKDLKHLEYFENLLQESNNDLVREAKEEGRKAIGYTCYQIPEPRDLSILL